MQNNYSFTIKRSFSYVRVEALMQTRLDDWKMNLMVVSEKHKYLIIAVDSEL